MSTAEDPPPKRSATRRPLGRGPAVVSDVPPNVRVSDIEDDAAGTEGEWHAETTVPPREQAAYGPAFGSEDADGDVPECPETGEVPEAAGQATAAGPEHAAEREFPAPTAARGPDEGHTKQPEPNPETKQRSAHPDDQGRGGEDQSGQDHAETSQHGADESADGRFTVVLDNFEGPFDLLLQLISKHKLDVTEVALSRVTDEFMAHIRAMGEKWDLDQTTEFLVVAATLLDLKAARLLPTAEVEDEADLALLEARDLLFARLLQYRAYKEIARIFAERTAAEERRYPRTVGLEPQHAELLPEVALRIGPEGFAQLAVKAMRPKPKPQVYVEHIHAPLVSVREQAEVLISRLRQLQEATFQALSADAPDVLTVVARFLALLELYRERAVELEQPEALGELSVRWSGGEAAGPVVTDEFDQPAPAADGKAGKPGK